MRYPFSRSALMLLLVSSLYSGFLVVMRYFLTGQERFFFLIWNLFLAWIPFGIALVLWSRFHAKALSWFFWLGTFVWLLFLPNAFYIVTDLIHLKSSIVISFWFDIVMIMSFVWNGLLLGLLSTWMMHEVFEETYQSLKAWCMIHGILFLVAVGVYLGRFLRFNSWDILSNPSDIGIYIATNITSPLQNVRSYALVFFFYCFYALTYATYRTLQKKPDC